MLYNTTLNLKEKGHWKGLRSKYEKKIKIHVNEIRCEGAG
jgi:hypothetical protein